MGLEDVKSDILDDAKQKADRIIDEAEKEAEEIIEEAEEEAEKIEEEAKQEVEEKKESKRKKAISNAKMEAQELKLREKQEKLDESFRNFREKLSGLGEDERDSFLESCLDRANFDVDKVRASEDFEDPVNKRDLEFEEINEEGVIVISKDGSRRMDFTFDRILENFRQNHRKDVSKILFE